MISDKNSISRSRRVLHKERILAPFRTCIHSVSTCQMAAPPLVYDYIGAVFTAILYGKYCLKHSVQMTSERLAIGLYCLLFGLFWRIQLKKVDSWKGVFFYALTINFILCTAYFIIEIIQVQFFITVSHSSRTLLFRCHASGSR